MPKSESPFRIGEFFLSRRTNSENWCVSWFDRRTSQTRRKSLDTANLEQAKVRLANYAVLNSTLENAPATNVLVRDVLLRYFDSYAFELASAEAISHHLRIWLEFYGESRVSDLTVPAQEGFLAHLKARGHSAGYIRRIIGSGRSALQRAWKRQEIASVPFIQMPRKQAPGRKAAKLEPKEMAALLDAANAESNRLLLFCLIGLNTLARPSAIYELTVDQLRFDDRLVQLNPEGREQTKKYRPTVPMTSVLLPYLRKAAAESESGNVIEYRGRPVKSLKKAFAKAVAEAKLSATVTPYSIRHTMARELRRRGVDSWEVAGMLGHKKEGTTEIYAEYDPGFRSSAAEAIEQYCQSLQPFVASEDLKSLVGLRAKNVRAG